MYLFFDTETTGTGSSARVTQLAFILTDKDGNIIKEYESLVKPDGWKVPKQKFFIDNNMSTERCEKYGVPIAEVMEHFAEALSKCEYKIAHNIQFDNRMMLNEIKIFGATGKAFTSKNQFCTMLSTVDYCNIPGRFGKPKWPKLIELYVKLFNEEFDGAHDALADVKAMIKCFFKLKEQKIIKI